MHDLEPQSLTCFNKVADILASCVVCNLLFEVLSESVNLFGFPVKPLLVNLRGCGFRCFLGELFFDGEVPVLVPLLVCTHMVTDITCYGRQPMKQRGVVGQWVGVDCFGPDLFKVTVQFSGELVVVPLANRCKHCARKLGPLSGVQWGGISR